METQDTSNMLTDQDNSGSTDNSGHADNQEMSLYEEIDKFGEQYPKLAKFFLSAAKFFDK